MEKIIADLIKGAAESEGFMRGGKVNVEIGRDRGHETKIAAHTSTLAGGIPGIGPGLSGLNAAADSGSMGGGLLTGMGSGLGQVAGGLGGGALGGLAGKGLGGLAGNPELGALIGALLGGGGGMVGGGMLGAAGGRALGHTEKASMFSMSNPATATQKFLGGGAGAPHPAAPAAKTPPPLPAAALSRMHAESPFAAPPKMAMLNSEFVAGAHAACTTFGVKKAFVGPLIQGALAVAKKALPGVINAAKSPIGQQALGMGAQMGVQKIMTPKEPQQPQMPN